MFNEISKQFTTPCKIGGIVRRTYLGINRACAQSPKIQWGPIWSCTKVLITSLGQSRLNASRYQVDLCAKLNRLGCNGLFMLFMVIVGLLIIEYEDGVSLIIVILYWWVQNMVSDYIGFIIFWQKTYKCR